MKKKKKKKNKTAGAPTKYKEIFCQKMIDFFDQESYEDVEIKHYKAGKKTWTDIKRMPHKLPTMVEFARHIKQPIRTVYNWLDKKSGSFQEEFWHIFTYICKDLQQNFLIQNGLQGLYNPIFAKFVMINISDWKDKKEIETPTIPASINIFVQHIIKKAGLDDNERETNPSDIQSKARFN